MQAETTAIKQTNNKTNNCWNSRTFRESELHTRRMAFERLIAHMTNDVMVKGCHL